MPYSSGVFSLYATGNPVTTGTVISSSWCNSTLSDIATGLSTCVLKDGTQTVTANIPMSAFKLTGLAAGTTNGDSVRYEQVVGAFLPITGGTLTGDLLFTDATYDIGKSGATRPRDGFFSRNVVVGGTLQVVGIPTILTAAVDTNTTQAASTAFVLAQAASQSDANAMTSTTKYLTPNVNKIVLGTEASASTTSVDFTGIPSAVRRITIMGQGISTNGTSAIMVQLGDAGGPENAGYTGGIIECVAGGNAGTNNSTGFLLHTAAEAAATYDFTITLNLENSSAFRWLATVNNNKAATEPRCAFGGGAKATSAELNQVRITTAGGVNTFDAGVINISYER